MKKETCITPPGHAWMCQQLETGMGEIQRLTSLTQQEVSKIEADPLKVEEVCPGGTVLCGTCEAPFGAQGSSQTLPDFKDLNQRLPDPSA